MSQEQWTAVDAYLESLLVEDDEVLAATVRASAEAGLPDHQVSPTQGKLLQLFAQMQGARRILEIGTGSGYQAAVLAEIVAEVYSIEIIPSLAERSRRALKENGYGKVQVRSGDG